MRKAIIGLFLVVTGVLSAKTMAAPRFAAGPGFLSYPVCSRAGDPSSAAPGFCSFDWDESGNIYVAANNRYLIRNPQWSPQTLFDYGSLPYTFPSFVKAHGDQLYFGESGNFNSVMEIPQTGGTAFTLFTLAGTYDCDFNGQSQLIISANPGWAGSKIYAWWSGLTAPRLLADLQDPSGPVAVDRDDALYYGYGSADYPPAASDVVFYTATQVADAIQSGTPLSPSDGAVFAVMTGAASFAFDRDTPAQNLFVSSGAGIISRVSGPENLRPFARGSSPFTMRFQAGTGDYAAFIPGGGRLFVLGTDWADYASAIFAVEPCPQNFILDSGDYRADGASAFAVFRPAQGLWAIKDFTRRYFGSPGDLPVSGDWAGDGTALPAIFRPARGLWAIAGGTRFYFGKKGDIPLPRDYAEDGVTVAAVFSPGAGLWAERNITRFYFGEEGDFPLPEDYSGDGTTDPAIFRPATGLWSVRGITRFYFGESGDLPVPGDYDGVPGWEAAIYRPATGFWSVQNMTAFYYGEAGDWPVPADYDGNGSADAAVFRPSNGLWAVRDLTRIYFGSRLDCPASR